MEINEQLAEEVMTYLTGRRMSALGNLASHFHCSVEAFIPLVYQLEAQNRLRLSQSRCKSDCSSCGSCDGSNGQIPLTEKTIVISLEMSPEE